MRAHEAGVLHADLGTRGPAWLRRPDDVDTMDPALWSATAGRRADGVVEIGGVAVTDLAAEFGIPTYVLDEVDFRERARAYREAFEGFDVEKVADLEPPDVDRLAGDTRIVRNRKKIDATVHNARTMLDLEAEHGSFKRYLRSHGGFDQTVADLRRSFRFLGETGAYYFLYVVGEPVPSHEEWLASHPGVFDRRPASART